jgi:hypothetical protein
LTLALLASGCGSSAVPDATSGGASSATATSGTGASGQGGAGQTTTQGGGAGQGGGGPSTCPVPSGEGTVLALSKIFLGDTDPDGTHDPQSGWKHFGFNLDGKTSTKASNDLCHPAGGAAPAVVYPDGDFGIDNGFGKSLLPIFLGLSSDLSEKVNAEIAAGQESFLVHLVGLGQGPDTCGLQARYYLGSKLGAPPAWNGSDAWPVDPGLLANPQDVASTTEALLVDVTANQLVTKVPSTLRLALDLDGLPLVLNIQHARLTMKLDPNHDGAQGGIIAGILDTEAFIQQLKTGIGLFDKSLCTGSTIDGISNQIRQASDILKDGTQDPNKTCDGISIGIGFEAKKVVLGGIGPTTPAKPNPCAP